jgi:alpha/beta superfamily hydrolase
MKLQHVISRPPESEGLAFEVGAVICHPHPLFGGTMDNPVVRQVERHLKQHIPTLRFNFRGVGLSEGTYADGWGECDDVVAMGERLQDDMGVERVLVVGYSFGAAVGAVAATELPAAAGFVAIAFPAALFPEHAARAVTPKPKLFLHGTRDDVAAVAPTRAFHDLLPGPKAWVPIEGADHFFGGRTAEVGEIVEQHYLAGFWAASRAPGAQGRILGDA